MAKTILNFHFDYLNPSLREPVKYYLTDVFREGGSPPATPLKANHFAKQSLVEMWVISSPLIRKSLKIFAIKW